MALVYPLAPAQFFERLPISAWSFDLPGFAAVSRTGGGDILVAELGERVWQGEIAFGRLDRPELGPIEGLLNAVRAPGKPFLIYDRDRPFPAADPDGSILGVATPTILARDGSQTRLSITGLPPGYEITEGDYFGYTYAGGRRALHTFAESATADGSGEIASIEVAPNLRDAAVAGTPLTLGRPPIKAIIEPGSFNAPRREHRMSRGGAFRFVQSLR